MNRSDLPNLDYIARTGDPTPGTRFSPRVLAEEVQELLDFAKAAERRASYMEQQLLQTVKLWDADRESLYELRSRTSVCTACSDDSYPMGFYP
jgi:hypothetical protein